MLTFEQSQNQAIALATGRTTDDQQAASHSLWQVGAGFPAITKRLAERILAKEYIDFSDLPPAKGKNKAPNQALEGRVLVVQAADLAQSRRMIPDYPTWAQCFALYVAVVTSQDKGRIADMMAYQATVAKCTLKYKWPSWLVYDANFRQEAAGKDIP